MEGLYNTIDRYLSQTSIDWYSMSQAVGDNPVIILMYLVGCITLCISFYVIDFLLIKTTLKKGFGSEGQKKLTIWFMLFLFLCGTVFGVHIFSFFYPFYWVYSGIVCVTGFSAIFTVILYLKTFKHISSLPSYKEVSELQIENELLQKKVKVLHEHLDVWSQNVGFHINLLKNQHNKLSEEVHNSAETLIRGEDTELKNKVLESLNKIQDELSNLTDTIK